MKIKTQRVFLETAQKTRGKNWNCALLFNPEACCPSPINTTFCSSQISARAKAMNAAIAAPNFVRPLSSPTATSGAAASGSNPRRVALLWGGRAPPSLRSPSSRTRAAARSGGTLYDLLGVPSSGSSGDIKKAFKELALKYHPDVSPPDLAAEYTQRFIEVHEAYEILSDPDRRALYDDHLRSGVAVLFSGRRLDEVRTIDGLYFTFPFEILISNCFG